AWSGVTLIWSVTPDQTWTEVNRALTYALVLVVAIAAGSSHERSRELIAAGALGAVLVVTLYALGQKLFPGIHVGGIFSFNQTQLVPRLQEPFGYWNALGLFVALGIPIALVLAVDRRRGERLRLAALVAIQLMGLVVGLTYSRGAVLALVCGLVVVIAFSRARLRSLMWLALPCLAMVPPLVVGLTSHSLTNVSVSLAQRERAGLVLAGVVVLSVLALWMAGQRLLLLERSVEVSPRQAERIGRGLAGALAVGLVCASVAVALSSRGLSGTVSHAWTSFTTTRAIGNYNPGRLLSADSANRWVWWKEAASAFGNRPLGGWGAGSFGVVNLLYRHNTLSVQQPHSVPLQFLVETGIIGAMLALAAFASLVAVCAGGIRRSGGSERLLSAALLAGIAIYGVHALYDWDWDIPGVTLPAVLFAGVLIGARGHRPRSLIPHGVGPLARSLALAAATAVMCVFVLSGAAPSVAASKASAAVVTASSPSQSAIDRAQDDAAVATRLDPLSDAGPLANATIALRRGNLVRAQHYTLQAIRRDPNDVEAWQRLVFIEFARHDEVGVYQSLQRLLRLDPQGVTSKALARSAYLDFHR
ncbi:MAG: O-antigen ligase family protein, partial [Solirubrobacterales bacterium]|nr:O-antigen ligase family protein [Solirubrobacterales bacterium]